MVNTRPSLLPIALSLMEFAAWSLIITGVVSGDRVLVIIGVILMTGNFFVFLRRHRRHFTWR